MLVGLMPGEPEATGLLALMLLSDARMPARGDAARVVLLREQDRSLWDPSLVAEGQELVLACLRRRRLGPFQLQAAIQALHCAAPRFEDTDWAAIVRFYDRLLAVMPTPVVALNRAVAVGEIDGPEVGLAVLEDLASDLDGYHLLHAARGSMLERLGRTAEAADANGRAAALGPHRRRRVLPHPPPRRPHHRRIDTRRRRDTIGHRCPRKADPGCISPDHRLTGGMGASVHENALA